MTFEIFFNDLFFLSIPARGQGVFRTQSNIYYEAFSQNFFSKIYKKTPVPESLFNKVTGLCSAISLKETTPTQEFSDEFCEIIKTSFL